MADVKRVKPEEARQKAQSGEALLVCAYDSEEMCERLRLNGALTLAELKARLPGMSKEQEIVFYCQ